MAKDTTSKIKSLEELAALCERLRAKGKTVVLCHGVFDLLHPGHLKYFEAAAKRGDVLVVTLTKDEYVNKGPGRPIFNEYLRAESIAAIQSVDYVAVNDWPTAVDTIQLLKPDVYVKGSDYARREDDITGGIYLEEEAIRSVGGVLHVTDEITFSSTNLINTFLTPFTGEAKAFLGGLAARVPPRDITALLKGLADLRVLVVGDVIIDQYRYCTPIGKSQKDHIVSTRFEGEETFAGGVLAAANHIAGFVKEVSLVSVLGTTNDYAAFAGEHLRPNVTPAFSLWEGAPTVVKRKFVEPGSMRKLFEVIDIADGEQLPVKAEREVCARLEELLPKADMVLVADFGHGLVTPKVVRTLCKHAPFLAVNVQTNSANIGFNLVTKFPSADYVCIDEPEVRLACHDRNANIERLVLDVSRRLSCDKVIITRGHRGSLAYSVDEGFTEVPVFSREVVDTIGAGDAYFAVTAPCVLRGAPMDVVGFVGNAVGAMTVLVVGNRSPMERVPLLKYVDTLLK